MWRGELPGPAAGPCDVVRWPSTQHTTYNTKTWDWDVDMVLYRIYVFFSTKRFHTGSTSFSPHTCCRILSGNSYHSRTTVLRQILSDYASMIYDKWLLVDQQKNYLLKDLSNWTHKLNMRKPTITNHVKSLRWIFFCNIGAITHLYFPDYCQWQWQEMQISCTQSPCATPVSEWQSSTREKRQKREAQIQEQELVDGGDITRKTYDYSHSSLCWH